MQSVSPAINPTPWKVSTGRKWGLSITYILAFVASAAFVTLRALDEFKYNSKLLSNKKAQLALYLGVALALCTLYLVLGSALHKDDIKNLSSILEDPTKAKKFKEQLTSRDRYNSAGNILLSSSIFCIIASVTLVTTQILSSSRIVTGNKEVYIIASLIPLAFIFALIAEICYQKSEKKLAKIANDDKPSHVITKKGFIVAFDWDNTIINGFVHTYCMNHGINDNKATDDNVQKFLDSITPDGQSSNFAFRNKEKLETIFDKVIKNGGQLAITTFSSYPNAIKKILEKCFPNVASNFHISHGIISQDNGKNRHISETMKHYSLEDNARLILIDDDLNNIEIAKSNGNTAIHADIRDKKCKYLDDLDKGIDTLIKSEITIDQASEAKMSKAS